MKENKTARLELRLTPKEKEKIMEYAAAMGISASEVIRDLCFKIFNGSKEEK